MTSAMQPTFRAAREDNFGYCWAMFAAESAELLRSLNLDKAAQADHFRKHWCTAETRIIYLGGGDIGWLQCRPQDGTLFLAQIFINPAYQNRGLGTAVINHLLQEAAAAGQAMTLAVIRVNPAMRLYKRLGFYVTHEDEAKAYMRRELGVAAPIANLKG